MAKPVTRSTVPPTPQGGQRVEPALGSPHGPQLGLVYEREAALRKDFQAFAAMFSAAVHAFGGADALRMALGRDEDYYNKIKDGMNGARPVQLAWLGPLLDDPRSAMIILGYLSERAGFEPPVCHREVSEEDVAKAALEVIAESGQLRETFRAQIAKRLGVQPDRVKL